MGARHKPALAFSWKPGTSLPSPSHGSPAQAPAPSQEYSTKPHSTWSTGPSLFSGVPSGHRILTEHGTRLTQDYSIGPHLLTSTWSSALGRISRVQQYASKRTDLLAKWLWPQASAARHAGAQRHKERRQSCFARMSTLGLHKHAAPAHSPSLLLLPPALKPLPPHPLHRCKPSSLPTKTSRSSKLLDTTLRPLAVPLPPPFPPHSLRPSLPSTAPHAPLLLSVASASHIRPAPPNFKSASTQALRGCHGALRP